MCFLMSGLWRREDLDQFDLDHVSIFKPIRMIQEWTAVVGVTKVEYLRV